MLAKSVVIASLASLACAESTVTSMLIYFADNQALDASIVGNDATATTYSINCPPGTDGSDCGMGPGLYATIAGDTTTFAMDDEDYFHMTIKCTNSGSNALCTESAGGPQANFPGKSTSTIPLDEQMPVTITAGKVTSVDGASATSTSTSDSSESTSSESSSTDSASGSASQTASASKTSDASQTGADPTETGAAVKIGGLANVVVGGVAVAVMGAVL
ncbi:hypothetical protein BDV18DRAFT_145187 [Aspergillus unguis]